jgi:[glutamine synthetase] adenylyltransferase / [glutamine synthetase]-adenylyl-L-tyrosine phosphorylase
MRQGHPVPVGQFDLKHSPGGMVDIEFAVQFMVLGHGARHPELLPNLGNIALLQRAQACGLVPEPVGEHAALAYRALRQLQHRARLNEDANQMPLDPENPHQTSGLALWRALFGVTTP